MSMPLIPHSLNSVCHNWVNIMSKNQVNRIPFLHQVASHRFQTPYVLTDLSIIDRQLRTFNTQFPNVGVYYALKSNDADTIMRQVNDKVEGYDVASIGEIKKALAIGIKPSRLLFGNPVKSGTAIKKAHDLGVNKFVFQSEGELIKLAQYAPKARVILRISTGKDSTEAFAVSNEKFGSAPENALELLNKAKSLNLVPVGLSFHVGSQMSDPTAWAKALDVCYDLVRKAEKDGIVLNLIDIGGGFPVNYGPLQPGCKIEDIAKATMKKIEECPRKDIKFIAEPGRYLVAESSCVVTTILEVDQRTDKKWLFADVSIFHAFMEKFGFNEFPFPVYKIGDTGITQHEHYALTGPTCDSFDTMSKDVNLPEGLKIGDKLMINHSGAYSLVYASRFNGFNIPRVHFFESVLE